LAAASTTMPAANTRPKSAMATSRTSRMGAIRANSTVDCPLDLVLEVVRRRDPADGGIRFTAAARSPETTVVGVADLRPARLRRHEWRRPTWNARPISTNDCFPVPRAGDRTTSTLQKTLLDEPLLT